MFGQGPNGPTRPKVRFVKQCQSSSWFCSFGSIRFGSIRGNVGLVLLKVGQTLFRFVCKVLLATARIHLDW